MTAPRYVVLEHHWDGIHYDFMIEAGAKLRTWKLARPPAHDQPQAAVATFDHRLLYLTYEGPISGNRGHVVRWDGGTFSEELVDPNTFRLRLDGNRLHGIVELRRLEADNWEWLYRET